jgi:hypothetical protein
MWGIIPEKISLSSAKNFQWPLQWAWEVKSLGLQIQTYCSSDMQWPYEVTYMEQQLAVYDIERFNSILISMTFLEIAALRFSAIIINQKHLSSRGYSHAAIGFLRFAC